MYMLKTQSVLETMRKYPLTSICLACITAGAVQYCITPKGTTPKAEYIFVETTKVEYKYWGEVKEVVTYRNRDIVKVVTKPDGTKIETKIVEREGSDTKSATQIVQQVEERKVSESVVVVKPDRSKYNIGVVYEIDKNITTFSLTKLGITGSVRLGDTPLYFVVGFKRGINLGISLDL